MARVIYQEGPPSIGVWVDARTMVEHRRGVPSPIELPDDVARKLVRTAGLPVKWELYIPSIDEERPLKKTKTRKGGDA